MSNRNIRVISLATGAAVGGLGILLMVVILTSLPNTAGLEDVVKNKKILESVDSLLNGFFYLSYLAIGICSFLALGFGLLSGIKNPSKAKNSMIGIVGLIIVFIMSWAMADDKIYWVGLRPDEIVRMNEEISSHARRFSGMAVNAMYILLILTIGALASGEILRFIKSRR